MESAVFFVNDEGGFSFKPKPHFEVRAYFPQGVSVSTTHKMAIESAAKALSETLLAAGARRICREYTEGLVPEDPSFYQR